MWRRITLLKVNWQCWEFELGEQISTMEDRCKWFDADVQAEAILTLGHTNVQSHWVLGLKPLMQSNLNLLEVQETLALQMQQKLQPRDAT